MPESFHSEAVPGGIRIRLLTAPLDQVNTAGLVDELVHRALETDDRNLYLDFGAVDYLSSGVLGRLVVLHRRLQQAGGQLSLFNLSPAVSEVFKASLLTDLLDVRGIPLPN